MPPSKREEFDRAVALHQRGELAQAAVIYQQILAEAPDHAGAWHLLGVAQHQQGDPSGALESIGRAIGLDGSQGAYFNNYGAALQSLKRPVEALAFYRAAVQLKPDYVDAQFNLANLLERLGQSDKALQSYQQVLALNPAHAAAQRKAVGLAQRLGDTALASELLRQALQRLEREELATAAPGARRKRAELYQELGYAWVCLCRFAEAAAAYEQAVAAWPEFAVAHYNLACARAETGDAEGARQALHEACRLKPENAHWQLRSAVLCPYVFPSQGALDEYRDTLEKTVDELLVSRPLVSEENLLTTGFLPPFALSFQGGRTRSLKEKFAAVCRPWFKPEQRPARVTGRLRVGFVVTRGHEGLFLRCAGGIVEHLDREGCISRSEMATKGFEPVVFCDRGSVQRIRQGLSGASVLCCPFGDDLRDAAKVVGEARCDVLYHWEVGTDPLNYYLPFLQLAAVQCTSWGTQVTSGVREVGYYLSSEWIELPNAEFSGAELPVDGEHYTERLWRLKSLPTYQRRVPAPPATTRDYFGLPENRHLYLCPQNLLKLHPDQDALFAQLLRTDPQGLLLIKEGQFRHSGEQIRARFAQTLPDVLERVRFIPWQSSADYYRLLTIADVVLDALYYSAGSSCYDMFSLNLPIVALPGELNVGRYTQACYRRMGFTELIAATPDEYVAKAVRVGSDPDYRRQVRQALAELTPVLFDDLECVREHERFFTEAHE